MRTVQLCKLTIERYTKLRERYAGKTVANNLPVPTAVTNFKASKDTVMEDKILQLESLMLRLASMGIYIQEPMQIAILRVSLSNIIE